MSHRSSVVALVVLGGLSTGAGGAPPEPAPDILTPARAAIARMRASPKGPFARVAWVCKDGSIQPARPYACTEHGGGLRQHGLLDAEAQALVDAGTPVGTVLAALEPATLAADDLYRVRALVVERFLEASLDGWVMHRAKSYRGARQIEDEEAAARVLLDALLEGPALVERRVLALRFLRALPYDGDPALGDAIRGAATVLGDADPGFESVRAKIHSMPEAGDAELVAAYARKAPVAQRPGATELEALIRARFDPASRRQRLFEVSRKLRDKPTARALRRLAELRGDDPVQTLERASEVLILAGRALSTEPTPRRRRWLLDTMARVESIAVTAAAPLLRAELDRSRALGLLGPLLEAAEALGHLSPRERAQAERARLRAGSGSATDFVAGVAELERAPDWARARVVAELWRPLSRYQALEPRAALVVDDALRSGWMLPLATLLDRLGADVERLRSGGHRLLELPPAVGVGGDNPGLAIGPLRVLEPGAPASSLARTDIVLLREVPADLPPVAGLLTVGRESMLSHVALLAQNLGIPQVSLPPALASEVERWAGQTVALGVSVGRRVALGRLEAWTPTEREAMGAASSSARPALQIDAARLDLRTTRIGSLATISEKDAGVRVGPKAAELARLARLFPERVSPAAVIPFGAFVRHVSRPGPDGRSPLDALVAAYRDARDLAPDAAEARVLGALAELREAIATLPFPDGFEAEVEAALAALGAPGRFGVFVRSDTNVEDLKDFTGAGLNLTVPNRVGLPSVLAAIRAVWASPYAPRSYQWRQKLLANPEHVYPSVLLHRTVPSAISGVILTTDVERGGQGAFTVSASEGVASVVDGGAAETLVVRTSSSGRPSLRLLSSSRVATRKRIPEPPAEGVVVVPAEGRDPLLEDAVIRELIGVVAEVEAKMPAVAAGAAWDVEFGVAGGRVWLMQIRPLKRSRAAGAHPFLVAMDAAVRLPSGALELSERLP